MAGKAFLSYSSRDKDIVHRVYRLLGPTFAELDEQTFEHGLPTWESILRALDRCQIFVLFTSQHSLQSTWVDREIAEARRRLRRGQIKRILILSIDGTSYLSVPQPLRDFVWLL